MTSAPKYWHKAVKELTKNDPILKAIIQQHPGKFLRTRGDAFETLMRSIVGQQISVKAAASIWQRVCAKIAQDGGLMNAKRVLEIVPAELQACGLSARKLEYIRDLAKHFHEKKVHPEKWPTMSDDDIIHELVVIKGIGRWTAEMFLMFHLLRHNVFPKDDLGLQKGLAKAYRIRYPLTEANAKKFAKKFSPWGSVATWYLWRSLDPVVVEY